MRTEQTKTPKISAEQIEQNKQATLKRRAENERKAKNRRRGMKQMMEKNGTCDHTWSVAGTSPRLIIQFKQPSCPRCLKRRARYYWARARSAEGELYVPDRLERATEIIRKLQQEQNRS